MKSPPFRANRRALKAIFIKVDAKTWEYLFDAEKHNGLHEHRVKGPLCQAFYNTSGVMDWLCEMGYYTPAEFERAESLSPAWAGLAVRTHSLAG